MEEAKKLVINVVTWNSKAYLPGLLASLDEQESRDFTVTVVDNASDDGTVGWLQTERPDVAALRNFRNQGFARAHNQAIALALSRWDESNLDHRYILVANPDVEFAPTAIAQLIAYMEGHLQVAACGPKLLRAFMRNADEEHRAVDRSTTIDSTGMVVRKSRRVVDRGAGEEDRGQYDTAREVFGISGACVLLRASSLLEAKLAGEFFDEDFFAYKEDIDLAWRMRRLGMLVQYVPEAVAWHHRRAPSAPGAGWVQAWRMRTAKSPTVNFFSTRNHLWVMLKNEPWINILLYLPWWLPYEFAKCAASLLSWSAIKGEVASLVGLPKIWRKRRELSDRAKTNAAGLRKWVV